jgi:hypothetical protein
MENRLNSFKGYRKFFVFWRQPLRDKEEKEWKIVCNVASPVTNTLPHAIAKFSSVASPVTNILPHGIARFSYPHMGYMTLLLETWDVQKLPIK